MNVRAMAVYLEPLVKVAQPHQKGVAIAEAFAYLTGYTSFEEVYNNKIERRRFTNEEIKESLLLFARSNDDDENDDEIIDVDIQFVCI